MTTKEAFLSAINNKEGKDTISEFSTTFSLREALNKIRLITVASHVLPEFAMANTIKEVQKLAKTELDKPRMEVDELAVRNDLVVHPDHYRPGTYEAINVIREWGLNFALGNAVKYICRAGRKDPSKNIEDLQKAIFYLEDEIKNLKGQK